MNEVFIDKMLKKLGETVRILRNRKKLTQWELARLAELDRSYLQKVESGKNVSVATVLRICIALDVDVIFLFKLDWEVTSTVPQGTDARKEQAKYSERRCKTTAKEGLVHSKRSCGGGRKWYNNAILIRNIPKKSLRQNSIYDVK